MTKIYTDLNEKVRNIFIKCGMKPLYEKEGKLYEPIKNGKKLKEYKMQKNKDILQRSVMHDGEEYIILAEAKKLLNLSDKTIKYHLRDKNNNYVRTYKYNDRTYYSKQDIFNYFDKECEPFKALKENKAEAFKYRKINDVNLLIGDLETIYNLDTQRAIGNNSGAGNGHLQVGIGNELFLKHRIIAYVWCDNVMNKDCVHHINCVKTDNRAENLLWCTSKQHGKAGRLFGAIKASKTAEEAAASKLKYDDFIKTIAKENSGI